MSDEVFNNFGQKLSVRLCKKIDGQRVYTTEDSIRYTFFSSLLDVGIPHESIVLEYNHPNIGRAKIDTWVETFDGKRAIFEFKYDRNVMLDTHNKPRTMQAGSLFKDISRLRLWDDDDTRCFFIYVTDSEMRGYFSNPTNGLCDFFSLSQGKVLKINGEYLSGRPKTFQKSAGEIGECLLCCRYSKKLPDDHEVRVYEVLK